MLYLLCSVVPPSVCLMVPSITTTIGHVGTFYGKRRWIILELALLISVRFMIFRRETIAPKSLGLQAPLYRPLRLKIYTQSFRKPISFHLVVAQITASRFSRGAVCCRCIVANCNAERWARLSKLTMTKAKPFTTKLANWSLKSQCLRCRSIFGMTNLIQNTEKAILINSPGYGAMVIGSKFTDNRALPFMDDRTPP